MSIFDQAKTVAELREELEQYDDDAIVVMASDYGDRCGTKQAVFSTELEDVYVLESAYSNSGYKVVSDYNVEDVDEEPTRVVVLNADMLY